MNVNKYAFCEFCTIINYVTAFERLQLGDHGALVFRVAHVYMLYFMVDHTNLVARVYSVFKMAAGRTEDPEIHWRNSPRIVEYFVT